jgi:Ribonuclease G/E
MSKEMIISSSAHETRVAILEDDQVAEIFIERERSRGVVGNVYKGRVSKVLPGMQSAFVDLGLERDGFLYVTDVVASLEAARLAKDRLGAYLVLGVLASFTFQVIYNVTMSAGLAPVKGLTLPLMSYGGSSMIATLAAFGLILNVRMRRFTN